MDQNAGIGRLINIMNELREKCPWDKKQTIHTLRQQTIEETLNLQMRLQIKIGMESKKNWAIYSCT